MERMLLEVECPDIEDGGQFPPIHTGRGSDLSPEFRLKNLSPQAKTLAVTLEDLDHPLKGFPHWTIWDLPAAERIPGAIPKGKRLPSGAKQGIAYGLHRYAGPKPPNGHTHRYRFTVYALDASLGLNPYMGKRALLRAARGHILQSGSLTAAFQG